MKLAEALLLRADAQKRIAQLRERLNRSAKVQEGEAPPENPQELLVEMERVLVEYTDVIKRINRTNAATSFGQGRTLTDALAERDVLVTERKIVADLISASGARDFRYGRSEIKILPTVDVHQLQRRVDALSKRHRELDTAIQQMNWQVELL